MNKTVMMLLAGLSGTIGGYIPVLLGVNGLSGWSIIGAFFGGLAGIYIGYKLSDF